MPMLAKLGGIVIRMLRDRTLGVHLHVFYGGAEMVMGLSPNRVIQSEVPPWVEALVIDWARQHSQPLF